MKQYRALVLAGLMVIAPTAHAQTQERPPEVAATTDPQASAATLVRAMRAHLDANAAAPRAVPESPDRQFLVTLLHDGRPLGRGAARAWPQALERARSEARGEMPRGADALQQAAQERRLRDALLSVEVGDARVALAAQTFSQADWEVRAGLEGLAVTPPADAKLPDGSGPLRSVTVFPSEMMSRGSSGQSPAQALIAAVSEASDDATIAMAGVPGKELGDLIKSGWSFQRFPVTHAVELVKGSPPVTLTRGAALIPASSITLAGLRSWREKLASHVASRVREIEYEGERWMIVEEMLEGGPTADRGRTDSDADRLRAQMVVLALAQPQPRIATGLQRSLLERYPSGDRVPTQAENACALLGLLALPDPDRCAMLEPWPTLLPNAFALARQSMDAERDWIGTVPSAHRAMIALAITRYARHEPGDEAAATARAAVDSLLASEQPGALVTHMPWLAWAADELSAANDSPIGSPILREMRSQVWQAQIGPAVAKAEGLDLEGALLFGSGLDARRSIGWQTARPVAGIARMLASNSFTSEDERMGEVVRLVASLRFLRQLTMDESSVWNCEEPERVLWGVRNSPWDRRMSIEASVMTLLALDEAIAALDAIR